MVTQAHNGCVALSMKRITVLLADDNRLLRAEFRKILERQIDLEVVGEAKNGHEALAMVKKLRPAVVLMDVAMPVLNGLQSTCQILKIFFHSNQCIHLNSDSR
jgi:YesN/AraC family two-component response regulator